MSSSEGRRWSHKSLASSAEPKQQPLGASTRLATGTSRIGRPPPRGPFKPALKQQSPNNGATGRRVRQGETLTADKENSTANGPVGKRRTEPGKPATGTAASTSGGQKQQDLVAGSTRPGRLQRNPALSASVKLAMEEEFGQLQQKLDGLRRDSLRGNPTPAPGALEACAPPAAMTVTMRGQQQQQPVGTVARQPFAEVSGNAQLAGAQHQHKEHQHKEHQHKEQQPDLDFVQFEAAGEWESKSLMALAEQLFGDEGLREQCERGLTAQLQRTKDGATAETRIQELAGIVKNLRRCLREMMNRSRSFNEHAVRFEREATQQVESVKLASESSTKRLEAELAGAKREVAQAQAALKASAASWQSELDYSQTEIGRLRRELERVEGERDRAREELKSAESSRLALEEQVRGMKRETGQQLRELQVGRGEVQRNLSELQQAAERRERQMTEDLEQALRRAEEAAARAEQLEARRKAEEQRAVDLEQRLQQSTSETCAARAQAAALQDELEAHRRQHEQVVAEGKRVLGDYTDLQDNCSQLLAELEQQQAKASSLAAQLQQAQSAHAAEAAAWRIAAQQLQDEVEGLAGREAGLQAEKCQLKGALGSALAMKEASEARLAELVDQAQELQDQVSELQGEKQQLQARCTGLQASADNLRVQAEEERRAREEAQADRARGQAEAAETATKLAQIEGEMEALQDVIGTGDQRSMVNSLVTKVATLEHSLAEAELRRRKLHNQLVELQGNIRVFCRVRPAGGAPSALSCLPDGCHVRLGTEDGKEHDFGYDRVFGPNSRQADIFTEVSDLVQSALDGYKVCLFSYGQTGAGKTYTMQGTSTAQGQGIIPRAVHKILEEVAKLREQGWEYDLQASFIEVYNESLRDLLATGGGGGSGAAAPGGGGAPGRIPDQNAIRHNSEGGHTFVAGASRLPVSSYADAEAIMSTAASSRSVEATAMNAVSSRSHSVFMVYITGRNAALDTVVHGALNLVDLAGSERLARSQVEGQRQKEACAINKSLSALGDVFQALSTKSAHVPYRNSKLTHLLQPCLGGDGKTLMFVNINPEAASAQESLCSLRFAAKINACETGARGGAKRHVSTMSGAADGGEGRRTSVMGGGGGSEDARRASLYGVKRKPGAAGGCVPAATRRKLG